MPLSHHSPKLCPQTDINEKILNGGGSSSSTEFPNPPEARKHFPLHFMVCWIFCFSCCIAGIMFMALEYSCGFPNASDLIWHLPYKKIFYCPIYFFAVKTVPFPVLWRGPGVWQWSRGVVPQLVRSPALHFSRQGSHKKTAPDGQERSAL